MQRIIVFILAAAILLPATALAEEIVIVSEEWEEATNADGTGFYWDVIKKVFEPAGYTVKTETMPYARSVNAVEKGQAHAWVASYINETDWAVYPAVNLDADQVAGVFKKGALDPAKGAAALDGKNVGWIKGYGYDEYLDVPVTMQEVTSRDSGMKMVERDRMDVFLDAKHELKAELEKGEVDAAALEMADFLELKTYLAFQNSDLGRKLAQVWDERMKELHASGELKALYSGAAYTEVYPFK